VKWEDVRQGPTISYPQKLIDVIHTDTRMCGEGYNVVVYLPSNRFKVTVTEIEDVEAEART